MEISPDLHFKRLWLIIGWGFIMIIVTLSLIPPPSIMINSMESGDKIGHFIAYFIVMGWFAQIYQLPRQRFYIMLSFIGLGILLEVLQGFSSFRTSSWLDIVANSAGILLAWQFTKGQLAHSLAYFEKNVIFKFTHYV